MFGSHLSISGGMHNAIVEARKLGMETVQVFTKNQQQWAVKPLERDAIDSWSSACKDAGYSQTVSHDSYLINLASPDPALRDKSTNLFREEIARCEALAIPFLVTHPGAHMGTRDNPDDEKAGIARIASALDQLLAEVPKGRTTVCLEITAGQGTSLGHRLEHLASVIDAMKSKKRMGVCLDTAHLFAAGYDFRGKLYTKLVSQIDQTIGLERVKVWHLNDSKKALGSRVDRHDHIGRGAIGLEGFRPIVNDNRWRETPKILETAKEDHPEGGPWDAVNLRVLRELMR